MDAIYCCRRTICRFWGSCVNLKRRRGVLIILLSIYAAVYSAAAQDGLQHENEALSELNRALVLAAADGIVMPFVENFDVLNRCSKAAQQNSGEPELLAKILELGAVYQENLKISSTKLRISWAAKL